MLKHFPAHPAWKTLGLSQPVKHGAAGRWIFTLHIKQIERRGGCGGGQGSGSSRAGLGLGRLGCDLLGLGNGKEGGCRAIVKQHGSWKMLVAFLDLSPVFQGSGTRVPLTAPWQIF